MKEITYHNGDAVEEMSRIDNSYGCTAIIVRVLDGDHAGDERVIMVTTDAPQLEADDFAVVGTITETKDLASVIEEGLIQMVRNGEYGVPMSEWKEGSMETDGMVASDVPYYEIVETTHFAVRRNDRIHVMRVKNSEVEYQNSRGNWKIAQAGML